MELIDAHCHFDFPEFNGTRSAAWERARRAGLTGLVIPGVRRADWARVRQVARERPQWWYCLGIHPWFVAEHRQQDLPDLERELLSGDDCCVGLGECGLDRLRGKLDEQMPWFEAQVDIASRLGLTLVIHSVRTHDEVAAVLRRRRPDVPVLVHGFSGSYQQGKALVDLGCYLGIGGVITYPRARKTRDAVSRLPLEHLVLETDAPDMPPSGVAKGANEPANLQQMLLELAKLSSCAPESLALQLAANVVRLYQRQSAS